MKKHLNIDGYIESAMEKGTYEANMEKAAKAFAALQREEGEIWLAFFADMVVNYVENDTEERREFLRTFGTELHKEWVRKEKDRVEGEPNEYIFEALERTEITWQGDKKKILDRSGEKWVFASRSIAAFVAGEVCGYYTLVERNTGYKNLRSAYAKIKRQNSPYSKITEIINRCKKERKELK